MADQQTESVWRIVTAHHEGEWPCTIVDGRGRSLLGVHNGTPIIRDRTLAETVVAALNAPRGVTVDELGVRLSGNAEIDAFRSEAIISGGRRQARWTPEWVAVAIKQGHEAFSRRRTSFPDVVTNWSPHKPPVQHGEADQ